MALESDLNEISEIIADLTAQKVSLSIGLQPYWNGKEHNRLRIMATFKSDTRGVIRFSFEQSAKRRTIYDDNMKLSEQYGDLAEQYRDVCADIEANKRNLKRLNLLMEKRHGANSYPETDDQGRV